MLWSTLLKTYELPDTEAHIFTIPSKRNKTLYNSELNTLRTATECMSSIFGGANTICNITYDSFYKKSNAKSEKLALNQLLILKDNFSENSQKYTNGNYYIEWLSEQLAEKALNIFKQIEKGGGFLKQVKKGTIQKKIAETAHKEQELFNNKELIITENNQIDAMQNKMKDSIELFPFTKKRSRKTIIQPIISKRLTEDLEQKRLKDE